MREHVVASKDMCKVVIHVTDAPDCTMDSINQNYAELSEPLAKLSSDRRKAKLLD